MSLFEKHSKGIRILKRDSDAEELLNELKLIQKTYEDLPTFSAKNTLYKDLQKTIATIASGMKGENQIVRYLEFRNPALIVLRDLFFRVTDQVTAQIDFIIISPHCIFITESKNLKSGTTLMVDETGHVSSPTGISYPWRDPLYQNGDHMAAMQQFMEQDPLLRKYTKRLFNLVVLSNENTSVEYTDISICTRSRIVNIKQLDEILSQNIYGKWRLTYPKMLKLAEGFLQKASKNLYDLTDQYKVLLETPQRPSAPILQDKSTTLYLSCSDSDEGAVKRLGAKWDPNGKKWYVTDRKDYDKFVRWILDGREEIYILRDFFYLIYGAKECYRCHKRTLVIAFGIENYAEVVDPSVYNTKSPISWHSGDIHIVPFIENLPPSLYRFLEERFKFYYDYSKSADEHYHANHCKHCGILQGRFFLFNEDSSPFFIHDKREASQLYLERWHLDTDIITDLEIQYSSTDSLIKQYSNFAGGPYPI